MYVNLPVWKLSPFVRIIPSFIAGIIAQWYFDVSYICHVTGVVFLLLFIFFLSLTPIHKQYRFRFVKGIAIIFLLFLSGMLLTFYADKKHDPKWYGHDLQNNDRLLLRLIEPPVEKIKTWKCLAETEAIVYPLYKKVKGTLIIYFQKSDSFHLKYGDRILVNAAVTNIMNSGNPGSFDYERYMKLHGIYHQLFLKKQQYLYVDERPSSFQKFIFYLRDRALDLLKKNISGKENIGVAEALIIGYKEELDKDLVQAYSNAGVVHIISISGLHLGLVYILLMWILARLPYVKNKKVIQWIMVVLGLWLFACITGCPPSALRSAVMFSFIITGKTFFKHHSTYNALCSSAFILLCYDPYYLWDVGFQLSYIAVFGIVWLQSPVNKLFYFRNRYAQKLWSLLSVTLAAQLITSPMCMYYFHQFPNLFLITNIVAVPASTAVLFGGILLLTISPVPILCSIAGKCVGLLIQLMNGFIVCINELSFAVTDRISTSLFSAWMLYAIVVCTSLAILFKKKKMLIPAFAFFLIFSIEQIAQDMKRNRQHKMIVFNIAKLSAIQFIEGKNSVLQADSSLLKTEMLFNFHIKPAEILLRVDHTNKELIKDNAVFLFNNKIILRLNKGVTCLKNIKTDIVILSDNVPVRIEKLKQLQPSLIIFDASNSLWKIEQWKTECEKLHLPYHSVPSSGAYILDQ